MAHKLGIEKFERPNGYTWHHEPDGTGMVLVDRAAHDKTVGGATHDGGGSLVKGQNF